MYIKDYEFLMSIKIVKVKRYHALPSLNFKARKHMAKPDENKTRKLPDKTPRRHLIDHKRVNPNIEDD